MALRNLDPHVRIVGSSGRTFEDQARRVGAEGVDHFVAKPYTPASLLYVLRKILTEGRPIS
ncbi:hypothetical protein BH09MYX1_BH09MYX1_34660 [soil metagenome]